MKDQCGAPPSLHAIKYHTESLFESSWLLHSPRTANATNMFENARTKSDIVLSALPVYTLVVSFLTRCMTIQKNVGTVHLEDDHTDLRLLCELPAK